MSSVASLRQIRRRIRSVENTKKITRAMEMVAAVKLRRFQDFLESALPYTQRMEELTNQLLQNLPSDSRYYHPYLEGRGTVIKAALVIFTSDTGLCGTYNSDLETLAQRWVGENKEKEVSLVFVGKHGANALHRRSNRVLATLSDLRVSRVDEILVELKNTIEKAFLNSEVNEVHVVYSKVESLASFRPITERILPMVRSEARTEEAVRILIEPSAKTVLDKLIPTFFEAKLRFIFYHALLTEQIARMSAMRQATQNAEEMIDELTLLRNKARQASITKEIIEIVSGSRALKLK